MTLKWNGAEVLAREEEALNVAAEKMGTYLIEQCDPTVPHMSGELEKSGRWETTGPGAGVVVYDEPYAAVQHERLDYHHSPPHRAKYLELAAQEHGSAAVAVAATVLREAL